MNDPAAGASGTDAAGNAWEAYKFVAGQFQDALPNEFSVLHGKFFGAAQLADTFDGDKDVIERAAGAVDFGANAVGATASALQAGSGGLGAGGAAAGAVATAAGFFSIASLTLAQFMLMGAPVKEAVDRAAAEGEEHGYRLGFAAGACSADPDWVKNELQGFVRSGDTSAHQARIDGFVEGLWEGYERASAMSLEEKGEYQQNVLRFAADREEWMGGTGDPYTRLVFGMARVAGLEGAPAMSSGYSSAVAEDANAIESAGAAEDVDGDRSPDISVPGDEALQPLALSDEEEEPDALMSVPGDDGDKSPAPPDEDDALMSVPGDAAPLPLPDANVLLPDDSYASVPLPGEEAGGHMSVPGDDGPVVLPDEGEGAEEMSVPGDDGSDLLPLPDGEDRDALMSVPGDDPSEPIPLPDGEDPGALVSVPGDDPSEPLPLPDGQVSVPDDDLSAGGDAQGEDAVDPVDSGGGL